MIRIFWIAFFLGSLLNAQDHVSYNDIRKLCWNEQEQIFDFTHVSWQILPHNDQMNLAKKYQVWYSKKIGEETYKTYKSANTKIDLILIPPGKFYSQDYSKILLKKVVTIKKYFWIGKYEMTQKQWQEVMEKNPSFFQESIWQPVENVSWEDCETFCRRIGGFLPDKNQWSMRVAQERLITITQKIATTQLLTTILTILQ